MIGAIVGFPILCSYDWSKGYLGPTPSFSKARDHVCLLSLLLLSCMPALISARSFSPPVAFQTQHVSGHTPTHTR